MGREASRWGAGNAEEEDKEGTSLEDEDEEKEEGGGISAASSPAPSRPPTDAVTRADPSRDELEGVPLRAWSCSPLCPRKRLIPF